MAYTQLWQRVQEKTAVTLLQCMQNQAPETNWVDYCVLVSNVATHQHLRSTQNHTQVAVFCNQTSLDCATQIQSLGLLCFGPDEVERTARRYPRPVVQCQWLQANVKDCTVHQILMYLVWPTYCIKSRYINLPLILVAMTSCDSHTASWPSGW